MDETSPWARHLADPRSQFPPEVVAAIGRVDAQLAEQADTDAVVGALREQGLGFIHCMVGLMAMKGVSLADAKWLVHDSYPMAEGRTDRAAVWTEMYEAVTRMPEVRQETTPAA